MTPNLLSFQNTGLEHPGTYDFLAELGSALRTRALDPGRWASTHHLFAGRDRPVVGAISGGRTSAMMGALMGGGHLTWLEYRPPLRRGAPPKEARVAVVDYKTADRSGGPFEALLEALNAFRDVKGRPPIAPWWRGRLCTAYLKFKTQTAWLKSRRWKRYETFVGLRADEPERVERLKKSRDFGKDKTARAPLCDAGIVKADVMEFWSGQPFDLGIREDQGNCTACFLKDEADLARVLQEPETQAEIWERMAARWPRFGGRKFRGYAALREEGPIRLWIEEELRAGRTPRWDGQLEANRFRLVVIQERRRLRNQKTPFSCACEGAETLAGMDEEAEEAYVLGLEGEA